MGWEAKAEEAPGLAGSSGPKLARGVDKEHNSEPVSWAPSVRVGSEHVSVRMKWVGWHALKPFLMGVRIKPESESVCRSIKHHHYLSRSPHPFP